MDFYEVADQIVKLLQSRGRLTYRSLKRQFDLDDDVLMVPFLFYSQLAILVLLWGCVMLFSLWPSPPSAAPRTPPQPLKPKRKRSREPTPFVGSTATRCIVCRAAWHKGWPDQ